MGEMYFCILAEFLNCVAPLRGIEAVFSYKHVFKNSISDNICIFEKVCNVADFNEYILSIVAISICIISILVFAIVPNCRTRVLGLPYSIVAVITIAKAPVVTPVPKG